MVFAPLKTHTLFLEKLVPNPGKSVTQLGAWRKSELLNRLALLCPRNKKTPLFQKGEHLQIVLVPTYNQ